MNLYLLEQDEIDGYDIYDSCIVAADSEEEAKRIHPSGGTVGKEDIRFLTWTADASKVKCSFIGVAKEEIKCGVICASFNAG